MTEFFLAILSFSDFELPQSFFKKDKWDYGHFVEIKKKKKKKKKKRTKKKRGEIWVGKHTHFHTFRTRKKRTK